jgi:hypothetical protein
MGCIGDSPSQLRGITPEERLLIARDTSNYTYIKWIETSINFGTINSGDKIKLIYRFKNVGEKPLFILSVSEACNCSTTEYNSDPIQPGKQGTITVNFNSKTQIDAIRKSLIVETNTHEKRYHRLIFTGNVRDCCAEIDDDPEDESDYIIK